MSRSTHLFVVAVEKYLDKAIRPVAFAEADGREFAEAWVDACTDTVVNEVLVNADATKTAVMSRFKAFCRHVGEDDMLVFFYAGHGVRLTGSNRLTTHDTLVSDLDGTTIVLSELLDLVTDECKSKRSILFIDACHSGIQLDARMRGIVDSFSVTEFDQFCSDAEYRVGFASCKSDESSWSHGSVKHGLWTHLILNALRGNAPEALHKGALVSSTSLQDYSQRTCRHFCAKQLQRKG